MTTISNESGLEPTGQAILCIPYLPEYDRTILTIPEPALNLELMREMRATVIELGPDCYKSYSNGSWTQMSPRCQVGDKVLITKFAGVLVKGPLDGKIYRLCNDQDVFCRLRGDISKMFLADPVAESKRTGGEARSMARVLSGRS